MSKNLENEYREMIRADVPDIWSKIEAKLDAQKAATTENTINSKKVIRWQRFALPAAAVLCAAVIIPVLINVRSAQTNHSSRAKYESADSAAATDAALGFDMADPEMTTTTAEYAAEECAPEAAAEEAFTTNGTAAYGIVSDAAAKDATPDMEETQEAFAEAEMADEAGDSEAAESGETDNRLEEAGASETTESATYSDRIDVAGADGLLCLRPAEGADFAEAQKLARSLGAELTETKEAGTRAWLLEYDPSVNAEVIAVVFLESGLVMEVTVEKAE